MSPIVDTNYHVRAASDGTIDDSTTCIVSVEIEGTGARGLALMVNVPSAVTGCVPLLTITLYAATTSSAATTGEIIAQRVISEATTAQQYIMPFFTKKRSVAFEFVVSGGSSPAFSQVDAWIVPNVGLDWTRTNETHG